MEQQPLKIEVDDGGFDFGWKAVVGALVAGALIGGGAVNSCNFRRAAELSASRAEYQREMRGLAEENRRLQDAAESSAARANRAEAKANETERALERLQAELERPEPLPVAATEPLPPVVIARTPPEVVTRLNYLEGALTRWGNYATGLEQQVALQEQRAAQLREALAEMENAYHEASDALALSEARAQLAEDRVHKWERSRLKQNLFVYGGGTIAMLLILAVSGG